MSFDEAQISDICRDLVSCGILQGAAETKNRRYVRVTRLMRRYLEALELVERVSDEATLNDSVDEKGWLGITRLDSALPLE